MKTAIDLHSWQRLAPMALLFLIVNGSVRLVRENFYAFAGAGAGFAFIDRLGLREFVFGGLVLLLGGVLAAAVYHRRFRFRIEGDAIHVHRGVIERKDLRIRLARIQNIGLSQPLYFRPFGLVRLTLETPGAESAEVVLPGIRRELAVALRDRIARHRDPEDGADAGADPAVDDEVRSTLYAPAGLRLFAHGLASNQVWLIAGVAAWLFGSLQERVGRWIEAAGIGTVLQRALDWGWSAAAGLVLGLVVLLFALSGLLSLLRFHGYCLRDLGDRLVAVGGLLDRREQTIRREKLTGLTLHQTALGRLGGLWYLVGRQAGSRLVGSDPSAQRFLIPGLRRADLDLIEHLMPGLAAPGPMRPISRLFRTRLWMRIGAAAVLAAALAWWHLPAFRLLAGAGLGLALVILYLVHRSWRCWGWQVVGGVCWIQQGLFGLRHDIFELAMVQQAVLVQSPYVRRHGLASVRMVLPHGQVTLPFIAIEDAAALVNRAIHAAETALVHRV